PSDIYTLSLPDALPIFRIGRGSGEIRGAFRFPGPQVLSGPEQLSRHSQTVALRFLFHHLLVIPQNGGISLGEMAQNRMPEQGQRDRKSTRLNSSHVKIS